jgi:hypothetical protein
VGQSQYIYIFFDDDGFVLACFTVKWQALRWYRNNTQSATLFRYQDDGDAAPVRMDIEAELNHESLNRT